MIPTREFCSRYGSITNADAEVMDATILKLLLMLRIKVLEIGMFRGGTGLGIKNFAALHGLEVKYWGVDAGYINDPVIPFDGATVIKGKSEEVVDDLPDDFHLIFVDGCHCRNHVILDTFNYSEKVVPGGFMVFHDTHPLEQGIGRQPCGDLINSDKPRFCTNVLNTFEIIHWPWPPWVLFMENYDREWNIGGMRSYQKTQ